MAFPRRLAQKRRTQQTVGSVYSQPSPTRTTTTTTGLYTHIQRPSQTLRSRAGPHTRSRAGSSARHRHLRPRHSLHPSAVIVSRRRMPLRRPGSGSSTYAEGTGDADVNLCDYLAILEWDDGEHDERLVRKQAESMRRKAGSEKRSRIDRDSVDARPGARSKEWNRYLNHVYESSSESEWVDASVPPSRSQSSARTGVSSLLGPKTRERSVEGSSFSATVDLRMYDEHGRETAANSGQSVKQGADPQYEGERAEQAAPEMKGRTWAEGQKALEETARTTIKHRLRKRSSISEILSLYLDREDNPWRQDPALQDRLESETSPAQEFPKARSYGEKAPGALLPKTSAEDRFDNGTPSSTLQRNDGANEWTGSGNRKVGPDRLDERVQNRLSKQVGDRNYAIGFDRGRARPSDEGNRVAQLDEADALVAKSPTLYQNISVERHYGKKGQEQVKQRREPHSPLCRIEESSPPNSRSSMWGEQLEDWEKEGLRRNQEQADLCEIRHRKPLPNLDSATGSPASISNTVDGPRCTPSSSPLSPQTKTLRLIFDSPKQLSPASPGIKETYDLVRGLQQQTNDASGMLGRPGINRSISSPKRFVTKESLQENSLHHRALQRSSSAKERMPALQRARTKLFRMAK